MLSTSPGPRARGLLTIRDVSGLSLPPAFFSFFFLNRQGDLPWSVNWSEGHMMLWTHLLLPTPYPETLSLSLKTETISFRNCFSLSNSISSATEVIFKHSKAFISMLPSRACVHVTLPGLWAVDVAGGVADHPSPQLGSDPGGCFWMGLRGKGQVWVRAGKQSVVS